MDIITAIALDLGTTAIKAGLLDGEGNLGSIVARPAPQIAVNGGRYESDALAYAQVAEQVLGECVAHAGSAPLSSLPLGLCSQRSSFLVWDRASGQPLTPLISWQDNRGAASCDALRDSEGMIRDLTGLRLTQYYFAPKLRVVLQEHPEWRARLERGELLAGTLDTFLVWRWMGGKHHVTDASMAARTLLMDIRQQRWSYALCELFGIPLSMLPQITPSAGLNLHLDNGLTLEASLGDQSAALIASVGSSRSDVLVNLGTGGFVIRYLEEGEFALDDAIGHSSSLFGLDRQGFYPHLNPPPQGGGDLAPSTLSGRDGMGVGIEGPAQDGYLRTLVYQDPRLRMHFAIEGTLNSLAAALAPYPVGDCRSEDLARDDVFCLAEPSGLGAPYFREDLGIRFSAPVEHLPPRQVGCLLLEGIIFRVARILEDFHRASEIGRVYLSGGLSELACLQQGIAQCAPCDVYRLRQKDASLQGAALLAAGMVRAPRIDAERIQVTRGDMALPEKYGWWKGWFDALLQGVKGRDESRPYESAMPFDTSGRTD